MSDFNTVCDLLKSALEDEKKEQRQQKFEKKRLDGVGDLLKRLKNPPPPKERIALGSTGAVINQSQALNGRLNNLIVQLPIVIRAQNDEIANAVAHPTRPSEIRRVIRSKMIRCKRCRNRFLEKHLYERHLRDRHPPDYIEYLIKQEEEVIQQRKEEIAANRVDEIVSGGFIPPAEELESSNFDIDVESIPLPGELSNGIPARFDQFGVLHQPKRAYRRKISPQCPFCDKRFRNEHSLKKHILKKHPDCVEFAQCLKCFKALPSEADMSTHLCEMVHICFECTPNRNMCTEIRLEKHRMKFHRGGNSGFKCSFCNLKFLTPRKLRKHKKMQHVFTKVYRCHFCEELFTSETDVSKHERIHTGIIKFECKICDHKCNRFVTMEEHRKTEHGYICPVCQVKVSEYGDMKNHTLIEHGGYLSSEFSAGFIESPRVWVMFKGE